MRTRTTLALAATGLAMLAGCGTQNATDEAQKQASSAQTAIQHQQALSPKAQQVLQDAQALAGDVATTAKAYANQDVTSQQAQHKFDDYGRRAGDLADRAKGLPAGEKARSSLTQLTDQLQQATKKLRSSVGGSGDAADLQSTVDGLRETAKSTYDQLQGQLPAAARQRIDAARKALGG